MNLPTSERPAHWILLRGLARESRHWGPFPKLLEDALSHARPTAGVRSRVDCIDIPGAGIYSEMRTPFTMKEIAEFVREKYTELRRRLRGQGEALPDETYLLAVSMGGMVASHWMKEWPRDLTGCVLINTSFGGFSPIYHRLQWRAVINLTRILSARDALTQEEEVLRMVSNRPETYANIAREWARVSLSRPIRPENFLFQLAAARAFRAPVTRPSVPILVVSSVQDRMVSPACSAEIARRWRCQHVQHPTGGHDLPLDEPQWVVDQVVSWWTKISS